MEQGSMRIAPKALRKSSSAHGSNWKCRVVLYWDSVAIEA